MHAKPVRLGAAVSAAFLCIVVMMLALDVLWIGFIAKSQYQQGIGHLMADQPVILAAVAFYLLYATGIMVFAVTPATYGRGVAQAALKGAVFGLVAYGTYDLTNLATLREWPLRLSLMDMAWGSAISALAAGTARAVFTAEFFSRRPTQPLR